MASSTKDHGWPWDVPMSGNSTLPATMHQWTLGVIAGGEEISRSVVLLIPRRKNHARPCPTISTGHAISR